VAENKTKENKQSVAAFLNAIEDKRKKADAKKVAAMMREATGCRAKMWGASIVGFGTYKTDKSCLYLNKLDDVDEKVLKKLIGDSVKLMRKRYNVK
jgi:hypothetical protein